jgi:hypothetical protein
VLALPLALIDADDFVEHLIAQAVEGVAADDRTVGAAMRWQNLQCSACEPRPFASLIVDRSAGAR